MQGFIEKHPKLWKWVREGGLFVIVSNLITVLKYLILQFLPGMLKSLPDTDFGWPGINMTIAGETFKWNILGYDTAHGGLPYFCAYMVAMVVGECINFPLQRNVTFRSHGPLPPQILAHGAATIAVFLVMNLFTCVWNPVAGAIITNEALRNTVQSIVTTVVTGGVAMVIIFAVDKTIFSPGWGEKK